MVSTSSCLHMGGLGGLSGAGGMGAKECRWQTLGMRTERRHRLGAFVYICRNTTCRLKTQDSRLTLCLLWDRWQRPWQRSLADSERLCRQLRKRCNDISSLDVCRELVRLIPIVVDVARARERPLIHLLVAPASVDVDVKAVAVRVGFWVYTLHAVDAVAVVVTLGDVERGHGWRAREGARRGTR